MQLTAAASSSCPYSFASFFVVKTGLMSTSGSREQSQPISGQLIGKVLSFRLVLHGQVQPFGGAYSAAN